MRRSSSRTARRSSRSRGAMTPGGSAPVVPHPAASSAASSTASRRRARTSTTTRTASSATASARSNPNAGDLQYRLARIIRIYDLGFWEETLLETDQLFSRHPPQARVPEEDDDARAALPARQAHRRRSRRRSGVKEPSLLSTAYKLRRAHLRGRGAGRLDLPEHREAEAAAGRRRSSSRSTSTTTSSRWARCSTTASRTLEEADGHLDPRRRRAQELHAAGRAAARPDPRRAHPRLRHRRAVLRRPGGQRRAQLVPGRRRPHLGQGLGRERADRHRCTCTPT